MSRDFISSGIQGVLDYGIDLKLESIEEETYYIIRMCDFFNEESEFKAYLSGDRSFEVEKDRDSPILEVIINDSKLIILPYTEEIFEPFTLVLSFIAKYHESLISELREKQVHRIETPSELNKRINNEEEDEEDPNSDDDFEWI